jgi:hypothetical protein
MRQQFSKGFNPALITRFFLDADSGFSPIPEIRQEGDEVLGLRGIRQYKSFNPALPGEFRQNDFNFFIT